MKPAKRTAPMASINFRVERASFEAIRSLAQHRKIAANDILTGTFSRCLSPIKMR
jgi:hypothetical protein